MEKVIELINKKIRDVIGEVNLHLKPIYIPIPKFDNTFGNTCNQNQTARFDFIMADMQDFYNRERKKQLIRNSCILRKKSEVLEILGLSKPTLDSYIKKGVIMEHMLDDWQIKDDHNRNVYYDLLEIRQSLKDYLKQTKNSKA